LEQEKHVLRRKLENMQTECDARIQEFHADVGVMRRELELAHESSRLTEREKAHLITQLTEQNQRLTSELKESNKQEELLMAQLQALRDQYNQKRTSMNDHVSQVELMRDELALLNNRRTELERRINMMNQERENLSTNLEESTDRILLLEKETRDRVNQIRISEQEINDLRTANSALVDRLEALSRHMSPASSSHSSVTHGQLSLLNELEMSGDDRDSELISYHNYKLRLIIVNDFPGGRPYSHPSLPSDGAIDEDIEFDDPQSGTISQEEISGVCFTRIYPKINNLTNNQISSIFTVTS
jgi:coiled-coil domain-containing protein 64